jgi:hypothetical protein
MKKWLLECQLYVCVCVCARARASLAPEQLDRLYSYSALKSLFIINQCPENMDIIATKRKKKDPSQEHEKHKITILITFQ